MTQTKDQMRAEFEPLPMRPKPEYKKGDYPSFGEIAFDCYSGVQMLEYGRKCFDAARAKRESMSQQGHPMQPVVVASDGKHRFLENRIISRLVEHGKKTGYGLNEIAFDFRAGVFSDEEQMQLAQLIGYSVDGYGTLSYVTDESHKSAITQSQKLEAHHNIGGGTRSELDKPRAATRSNHRALIEPRLVDLIAGLSRHQVEEAVRILLDYIDEGKSPQAGDRP